jgi:hypothetical protein
MEEIWRPIVSYEGKYEVSNLGNVKNAKTDRILKFSPNTFGYFMVSLNCYPCYVHRLVLQTFLPIDENKEVNHKNHIASDNRLENLEWCSSSENTRFQKKRKGLTSQYKGVSWHINKWRVQCKIDDKRINIGRFDDEKDAGKAYNDFVIKHDLQHFTILNKF